jgi:hypothetical protein
MTMGAGTIVRTTLWPQEADRATTVSAATVARRLMRLMGAMIAEMTALRCERPVLAGRRDADVLRLDNSLESAVTSYAARLDSLVGDGGREAQPVRP